MIITEDGRRYYQETGLKFEFRGKQIAVRDVANRVLTWVDKFTAVGDTVVQYGPVHAALPCAGIQLLLQVCFPFNAKARYQ